MSGDAENSALSAVRVIGRPFVKGMSPNPGGRPRSSLDFSAAAREHAPEYLAVLLKSLKSSNWRERHSALAMLLDRAFGKAPLAITGQDGAPLALLHLTAAKAVSAQLIAEQRHTIDGRVKPAPIDLLMQPPPLE